MRKFFTALGRFSTAHFPNSNKLLSDLLHQFAQFDINPHLMSQDILCGMEIIWLLMEDRSIIWAGICSWTQKKQKNIHHWSTFSFFFLKYRAKGVLLFDSSEMKYLLSHEIPALIYSRSELLIPFERCCILCWCLLIYHMRRGPSKWNLTGRWSLPSAPTLNPHRQHTVLHAVGWISSILYIFSADNITEPVGFNSDSGK